MYVDKDSSGRISIHELTIAEAEILQIATVAIASDQQYISKETTFLLCVAASLESVTLHNDLADTQRQIIEQTYPKIK